MVINRIAQGLVTITLNAVELDEFRWAIENNKQYKDWLTLIKQLYNTYETI